MLRILKRLGKTRKISDGKNPHTESSPRLSEPGTVARVVGCDRKKMPGLTPTPPTTIDDAPLDVLERALDLMIVDEELSSALALLRHRPQLLGHLRHLDVNSPLIDFPEFRRLYPKLAFHLDARRARARALASLGEQDMDKQIQQLEERLAQIRREAEAHAIGSPIAR